MSAPLQPLVALGIGNILMGDDAIGVRVIEALRATCPDGAGALPPGTRLVDGGTLGLELLPIVREARGVVLVDAVLLGDPAGTVSVLRGDAIVSAGGQQDGQAASAVGELMAVARLMDWLPEPVSMVGIEVADLGFGEHLSPPAEGALPAAVDAVRSELRRMDERSTVASAGGLAAGPKAGATA